MQLLIKSYYPILMQYFLLQLANDTLASELCNEVLLIATKESTLLKTVSSLKMGLLKIAYGVLMAYYGSNPTALLGSAPIVPAGRHGTSAISTNNQMLHTAQMLHTVPNPNRQILLLHYYLHLSFKEVGEIIEQTENYCLIHYYEQCQTINSIIKESKA